MGPVSPHKTPGPRWWAELLQLLALFNGKISDVTSLTLRIHDGTSPGISDDLYSRLDKFLRSVNTLAAFTAYDISKSILPFVVSRHGPHLRRLRFRQTNFNVRDENQIRCHSTFEELHNLASGLPQLQRLGVDLRFKGRLVCPRHGILTVMSRTPTN